MTLCCCACVVKVRRGARGPPACKAPSCPESQTGVDHAEGGPQPLPLSTFRGEPVQTSAAGVIMVLG